MSRKSKLVVLELALLLATVVIGTRTAAAQGTLTADKDRLIGAWHLASISGPDGKPVTADAPKGMLIYTRDGHMSVQLMYPASAQSLSNEYVRNGYEASFGRYDVNESTHTVTHHVPGANTLELLVGKDLPHVYSTRADA
jgi:hypothetical protein